MAAWQDGEQVSARLLERLSRRLNRLRISILQNEWALSLLDRSHDAAQFVRFVLRMEAPRFCFNRTQRDINSSTNSNTRNTGIRIRRLMPECHAWSENSTCSRRCVPDATGSDSRVLNVATQQSIFNTYNDSMVDNPRVRRKQNVNNQPHYDCLRDCRRVWATDWDARL